MRSVAYWGKRINNELTLPDMMHTPSAINQQEIYLYNVILAHSPTIMCLFHNDKS